MREEQHATGKIASYDKVNVKGKKTVGKIDVGKWIEGVGQEKKN
jgi:hypothetical protein